MTIPEASPGEVPSPPGGTVVQSPRRRCRWLIHLIIMGSYPILAGLLSFGRGATQTPALGHSAHAVLLVSCYQVGIFAVLFGLAWWASRASASDLQLGWRPGIWAVPLGFLYSIALRFGLALIAILVISGFVAGGIIRPDDLPQLVQQNRPNLGALVDVTALATDPVYYWLNLTLVSFVVAGLREELWRAAMLAGLRSLWPAWFGSRPGQIAAIGVAAALFGIGHVTQGAAAVGAAGLLGFGLGTIMVMHRSIWPAVIAHGLFDATTFAVLPWLMENMPQLR